MKTVILNNGVDKVFPENVNRLSDEKAAELVRLGTHNYGPKKIWKMLVRSKKATHLKLSDCNFYDHKGNVCGRLESGCHR